MVKLVLGLACFVLVLGQAVCQLECYQCYGCDEKNEADWEQVTCSDNTITATTIDPSFTSTPGTPVDTTSPDSPAETTTSDSAAETITSNPAAETTTSNPAAETTTSDPAAETTTSDPAAETTIIPEKSEQHPNFNRRNDGQKLLYTKFNRMALLKADDTEPEYRCAYIKYKVGEDEKVDRFCTKEQDCDDVKELHEKYKDTIKCNVCKSKNCNKDGGAGSIRSWAITTVLIVAISKPLFFN